MAGGTDGEKAFDKGCGKKHLNLQCMQCTRGKVDGTEERVPVGAYRNNCGKGENKERIVLERDSGPGLEARKEEKCKRKVAKVTPVFAGSCGKTGHIAANCAKGSWNRSSNSVEEGRGDISEEVHEDEDELRAWCLLEESENEQSPARNQR